MKILRSRALSLLVTLTIIAMPASAFAKTVAQELPIPDGEIVTRGDFLRATVNLLNLQSTSYDAKKTLPYARIPKGLEMYVRIADAKGALGAFGTDLTLAKGITRGEALQLIVGLAGTKSSKKISFTDVVPGSPEEAAVAAAVENGWMEALGGKLFGVRRVLTGKEAVMLLRKVVGDAGTATPANVEDQSTPHVQTIKIDLSSTQRLQNLPKTQILEALWNIVQKDFLYQDKINADKAAWKAAQGLIESLGDKYSVFMPPENAQNFQSQINGQVSGIGAQVDFVDGVLTIIAPISGSPAQAAGLQAGDQIIKVDGVSLAGLSLTDAVGKVRGPTGTTATLTIRRNGNELTVKVVRDIVRVPEDDVSWQGNVLVVKIAQFGKITDTDIRSVFQKAVAQQKPKGIVIDLRNNPGGLLDAADTFMSVFEPKGSTVAVIRANGSEKLETTSLDPIVDPSVKVMVLVNQGSASASEIVAGALQDYHRATVIGGKTYGKGTVQQVVQFVDQSSLKLTIAEWLTPLKRKIDGVGVLPDIEVKDETGRDAQMVKAMDLLR